MIGGYPMVALSLLRRFSYCFECMMLSAQARRHFPDQILPAICSAWAETPQIAQSRDDWIFELNNILLALPFETAECRRHHLTEGTMGKAKASDRKF